MTTRKKLPKGKEPAPIAVLCSDLHLSVNPPPFRAAEPNWMSRQASYLRELKDLSLGYRIPVLCAGDIFDSWNVSPELAVFALAELPKGMICVPGQHDLPNHNINQMHRSGYGILKEAGVIIDASDKWHCNIDFDVFGFPWGSELRPSPRKEDMNTKINVALVHRYAWAHDDTKYPDAPVDGHITALVKQLKNFDVVVFGDNHIGFTVNVGNTTVFNCGGFMRRKSDQGDYTPRVGLLYKDGFVGTHYLDISNDRCIEPETSVKDEIAVNMRGFIRSLEQLGEQGINFKETVRRHLTSDQVDPSVRSIVLEALENG